MRNSPEQAAIFKTVTRPDRPTITLYTPSGDILTYTNCLISQQIVPDLAFQGDDHEGIRRAIATTLAYKIDYPELRTEPAKVLRWHDSQPRLAVAASSGGS